MIVRPLQTDLRSGAVCVHVICAISIRLAKGRRVAHRDVQRVKNLRAFLHRSESHAEVGTIEFNRRTLEQLNHFAMGYDAISIVQYRRVDLRLSQQGAGVPTETCHQVFEAPQCISPHQ